MVVLGVPDQWEWTAVEKQARKRIRVLRHVPKPFIWQTVFGEAALASNRHSCQTLGVEQKNENPFSEVPGKSGGSVASSRVA
jgi:hypothetical protein